MALIQFMLVVSVGALFTEALIPPPGEIFDPCSNFPCHNGGRCVAPADLPRCECPIGFSGRNCEIKIGSPISRDPCVNFPCYNGGRCVAPADLPRCECPIGFSGRNCEIKIGIPPQCGPCPTGWTCKFTPDVVCVKAPCSAFTCLPPVFTDRCGGCPPGKKCKTFYPPCPPPPHGCGEDEFLPRLRKRSIPCPQYRCDPVHVCV